MATGIMGGDCMSSIIIPVSFCVDIVAKVELINTKTGQVDEVRYVNIVGDNPNDLGSILKRPVHGNNCI
jgi:hypothetical protein